MRQAPRADRTGRRAAGRPGVRRAATALRGATAMGADAPPSATRRRAHPGRERRATPTARAAQARSSSTATAGSDGQTGLIRLAKLVRPLGLTRTEHANAACRAAPTMIVAPHRTADIAQDARLGLQVRTDFVLEQEDLVCRVGQ